MPGELKRHLLAQTNACRAWPSAVRQCMTKPQAIGHVRDIALQSLPASDQSRFVEVAHDQLMNLHEGNMARYRLRPSEFVAWRREWEE